MDLFYLKMVVVGVVLFDTCSFPNLAEEREVVNLKMVDLFYSLKMVVLGVVLFDIYSFLDLMGEGRDHRCGDVECSPIP